MLIFKDTKFIKSPFDNEAELEQVIVDNYEYLFGPTSFYLPKAKIKTADGVGTIPDGFAIDIGLKKWYLVEAELMHHSVWNHIAPQVTKQILASQQSITKRILIDLAVHQYQTDNYTKEKFEDLLNYTPIKYHNKIRGYENMGINGLESVIIAYDNLLLSTIPDNKINSNMEFNWYTLFFNNVFFFGDNDSIGAISGAWYGALLGIDKFTLDKIKELEFYHELKKTVVLF